MNLYRPTALIILDGWGYSPKHAYNAIYQAHPTTFNMLIKNYPHTFLKASGQAVGLPIGMPGNSEVGHTTIGAGRIIPEPLTIINTAIAHGSFFSNPTLIKLLQTCVHKNGRLHVLGLLSDGSVHSWETHLFALIKAAVEHKIPHIYIHAFLDGRDVPPQSAAQYLIELEHVISGYKDSSTTISIASISGRFYAMDRDNNWQRTEAVYAMLIKKNISEHQTETWRSILAKNYNQHIFDEFIPPTLLDPHGTIHAHDTLFFFNIRPDRMRQLVSLFLTPENQHNDITVASMVPYKNDFDIPFLYQKEQPKDTLLDILQEHHLTIFTCAETQKYAHVTYFFNGGKEKIRPDETRVILPSHVSEDSYQSDPDMSASEITHAIVQSLEHTPCDFYLVNYANADMVGHSGNFESTKKAITCLDKQLKMIYEEIVEQRNGTLYITADHGNAEEKWDYKNNCPKKSHTTNKVPFIMVQKKLRGNSIHLPLTQLSDIKDFILNNLEYKKSSIKKSKST